MGFAEKKKAAIDIVVSGAIYWKQEAEGARARVDQRHRMDVNRRGQDFGAEVRRLKESCEKLYRQRDEERELARMSERELAEANDKLRRIITTWTPPPPTGITAPHQPNKDTIRALRKTIGDSLDRLEKELFGDHQ